VTLEIDIPENCRGGGGGGGPDTSPTTTISGPLTLINLPDAPIAVAAADEDLEHVGWWRFYEPGSTDYSITVRDWLGLAAVIAYHESDGNGLFEPSDYVGAATSNPIQLGIGDVTGVEIVIPSADPLDFPAPAQPIELAGNVAYDNYAGGDILIFASGSGMGGQLLGATTVAAPGPFTIEVPDNFFGMTLWAVADPEADGAYNLATDASDSLGPFNTDGDQAGLALILEEVPTTVGSVSGTITLNVPAGANDTLRVFLNEQGGSAPPATLVFGNPGSTVSYTFLAVEPGSYLVSAFLDYDSDAVGGPADDEPDTGSDIFVVAPATDVTGVDFSVQ